LEVFAGSQEEISLIHKLELFVGSQEEFSFIHAFALFLGIKEEVNLSLNFEYNFLKGEKTSIVINDTEVELKKNLAEIANKLMAVHSGFKMYQ